MLRETQENGVGKEIGFDEERVHVPFNCLREHRVFCNVQTF